MTVRWSLLQKTRKAIHFTWGASTAWCNLPFEGHFLRETRVAGFLGAPMINGWMRTTWCIGPTAEKPVSITRCYCAQSTTGCFTRAISASNPIATGIGSLALENSSLHSQVFEKHFRPEWALGNPSAGNSNSPPDSRNNPVIAAAARHWVIPASWRRGGCGRDFLIASN